MDALVIFARVSVTIMSATSLTRKAPPIRLAGVSSENHSGNFSGASDATPAAVTRSVECGIGAPGGALEDRAKGVGVVTEFHLT